jgi:hypothetical protein
MVAIRRNGCYATGLTAGTYTVTVTDANACTARNFTITQPTAISAATAAQTNVSCLMVDLTVQLR